MTLPPRRPGILGRQRLHFEDNVALRRYYEDKYAHGGYEGEGCSIHGLDVSQRYHAARHASALRLLAPVPTDVVLDAGCGDGALTRRLSPLCRQVCAVDIAANSAASDVRSLPNVRVEQMNLEALSFADAHVDKVVCVETLEHLLHPQRALGEFHRVLRPNGLLVVTYPTINRTTVQALQARVGLRTRLEVSEHLTEWSYDELIAHVESTGFAHEASEGIAFDFGLLGRLKYLSRAMAEGFTNAALAVRRFPRNSSFASLAFRRIG